MIMLVAFGADDRNRWFDRSPFKINHTTAKVSVLESEIASDGSPKQKQGEGFWFLLRLPEAPNR
jgi:hypothetical protein